MFGKKSCDRSLTAGLFTICHLWFNELYFRLICLIRHLIMLCYQKGFYISYDRYYCYRLNKFMYIF